MSLSFGIIAMYFLVAGMVWVLVFYECYNRQKDVQNKVDWHYALNKGFKFAITIFVFVCVWHFAMQVCYVYQVGFIFSLLVSFLISLCGFGFCYHFKIGGRDYCKPPVEDVSKKKVGNVRE